VWQARASKNRIFWKINNISTGRIQTKFTTRKRLNTRSILLLWLVANSEEFKEYSSFSRYEIFVCYEKNIRLFCFVFVKKCYYFWPSIKMQVLVSEINQSCIKIMISFSKRRMLFSLNHLLFRCLHFVTLWDANRAEASRLSLPSWLHPFPPALLRPAAPLKFQDPPCKVLWNVSHY
jgi:hypothetical protein